ncbi:MAG: GntR family transcriptional regulator, partial [Amylibacter sp.]
MGTIWQPSLSDFNGPKYKAVVAALKTDIAKGILKSGDKLPPVRELAWEIHVTPGTVARAYQDGIAEGLLQATVGRGTFVATASTDLPEIDSHYNTIQVQQINLRNTNTTNVGQAAAIKRAMIRVAETKVDQYLDYPERDGRHSIYSHLVQWMKYSNIDANPEKLIVTNGGQNAILLATASVLADGIGLIAIDALT